MKTEFSYRRVFLILALFISIGINLLVLMFGLFGRQILANIWFGYPEVVSGFEFGKTCLYLYEIAGGATDSNIYFLLDYEFQEVEDIDRSILTFSRCHGLPRVEFNDEISFQILTHCGDVNFRRPKNEAYRIELINRWD